MESAPPENFRFWFSVRLHQVDYSVFSVLIFMLLKNRSKSVGFPIFIALRILGMKVQKRAGSRLPVENPCSILFLSWTRKAFSRNYEDE